MIRQIKFIFIAVLILSNLQANLINPNFNLGYTLSTSAETNNRQLHKDEEKWLDDNIENFKEFFTDETGETLSDKQSRALLYHSANSMVDADANIGLLDKLFGYQKFDEADINTAQNFIIKNSQNLVFANYLDGSELPNFQQFFTATPEQFYEDKDFNPNNPGALIDVSGLFFGTGVGGGLIANAGTKGLSKIILNQEAKTSLKYGAIGAGVDTSLQVGSQIYDQAINNNGYVDFRDIHLNYPSIMFSGVAGSVAIPSMFKSASEIKYSFGARKELKEQLKNSQSLLRQNKIQNRLDEHNYNIYRHLGFQITNRTMTDIIKDNTIDNDGGK